MDRCADSAFSFSDFPTILSHPLIHPPIQGLGKSGRTDLGDTLVESEIAESVDRLLETSLGLLCLEELGELALCCLVKVLSHVRRTGGGEER